MKHTHVRYIDHLKQIHIGEDNPSNPMGIFLHGLNSFPEDIQPIAEELNLECSYH